MRRKQRKEREIRERKQRGAQEGRKRERQADGSHYRLHSVDAESLKLDHLKLIKEMIVVTDMLSP